MELEIRQIVMLLLCFMQILNITGTPYANEHDNNSSAASTSSNKFNGDKEDETEITVLPKLNSSLESETENYPPHSGDQYADRGKIGQKNNNGSYQLGDENHHYGYGEQLVDRKSPTVHKHSNVPTQRYRSNFVKQNSSISQQEEQNRVQAESARYSFSSSLENSINDNSHSRQEVRDGLKLTGHYSYSDGYYKRTIHYVADDKGYRVTNEVVEKIGDGPVENTKGSAVVNVMVNNENPLSYSIKGEDLKRTKPARTPIAIVKNKSSFA